MSLLPDQNQMDIIAKRQAELITNRQIQLAEEIAKKAHINQKRKDGKPYMTHIQAVAAQCYGMEKAIAYLHDVIEDTSWTAGDLKSKGICDFVINMVKVLTRKEGETYFDFIMRIKEHPPAVNVKIADIEHNLSDKLEEGFLKDKYRFALWILKKDQNHV